MPYLRHMNDAFSSSKNVYIAHLTSRANRHMELSEYIANLIDKLPEKAEKALQYIANEYEETVAILERSETNIMGLLALHQKKSNQILAVTLLLAMLQDNYEKKARIALEDE